jgi:hypothetical protein
MNKQHYCDKKEKYVSKILCEGGGSYRHNQQTGITVYQL